LPLHRLLGAVRDGVSVYASGGFTTYDDAQLADQLSSWIDQGIPRVTVAGTAFPPDSPGMA
jgi:L-alanine-DL-glutamate epimerase-like enolase superfamily enzyme